MDSEGEGRMRDVDISGPNFPRREEFFIHRSCSSLCQNVLCSVLWASIVGMILCCGG